MSMSPRDSQLRRSGYSAPGFSPRYDANRRRPSGILLDLLPFVAQAERPVLIVDLGGGTGLSTRFWSERAVSAVGVEPNSEIRPRSQTAAEERLPVLEGGDEPHPLALELEVPFLSEPRRRLSRETRRRARASSRSRSYSF